jgi:hypothetical protein
MPEHNTNNYDYIEDQGNAAVYQETAAVPYHCTGPDVSKSTKIATKPDQLRSTGNELAPSLYEAPAKQKFRVSDVIICYTCITYRQCNYLSFVPLLGSK